MYGCLYSPVEPFLPNSVYTDHLEDWRWLLRVVPMSRKVRGSVHRRNVCYLHDGSPCRVMWIIRTKLIFFSFFSFPTVLTKESCMSQLYVWMVQGIPRSQTMCSFIIHEESKYYSQWCHTLRFLGFVKNNWRIICRPSHQFWWCWNHTP